jgi:predicted AlkP superfamily pyrophosphatase or phosphodiesterase
MRACVLGLVAACGSDSPQPIAQKVAPTSVMAPAEPPAPPPKQEPAPPPQHVVIFSIDGLRPDMMTVDLMPRHVQLMAEGITATHASTIRESDTLPSHGAMLSGRGLAAHGLWWNSWKANRGYIKVPTIFTAATTAGLSTAMIVGKQKLKHIAAPNTVGHFERPSYLCGGVAKRAAAYFAEKRPDLLFVHFSDPDEYGHSHGWLSPEYVRAAKNSDACLATVLAAIDATDAGAKTLVIVTADHGGHDKAHSDGNSKENRHIPWIARGPGVKPGTIISEPIATVDTAATALAALGLPSLPDMAGEARLTFSR